MSQLIIDGKDLSAKVKDLSFNCGICGSHHTYIDFNPGCVYEGGGDIGSLLLGCLDCEACFNPIYDDEWVKLK